MTNECGGNGHDLEDAFRRFGTKYQAKFNPHAIYNQPDQFDTTPPHTFEYTPSKCSTNQPDDVINVADSLVQQPQNDMSETTTLWTGELTLY